MDKKVIEKKYNDLVSSVDNAPMYDGRSVFHGYTCKSCGFVTATAFKAKGVTPFIIRCQKCNGTALHNITSHSAPPQSDKISEVRYWVRPTLDQLCSMRNQATVEHVLNGGLIFEDEITNK